MREFLRTFRGREKSETALISVNSAQKRADLVISQLLINAVGRFELPQLVHVITQDDQTGLIFGGYIQLEKVAFGEQIGFTVVDHHVGWLVNRSAVEKIDWLIENYPGMPLICDEVIASMLKRNPASKKGRKENYYQILIRPRGNIVVITPQPSVNIPPDQLPPPFSKGISYLK